MDSFIRDLRRGLRAVLRNPAVTLLMIFALAVGVGMNASSYVTVSAIVLHPFPFPRIDRIVTAGESLPGQTSGQEAVSPANFRDWKEQSHSFAYLAAFRPLDAVLTGSGQAERVDATGVTADFFRLLGIAPERGRTFRSDEMQPGRPRVAVVSHGFWQHRMAASPVAIGQTISLDGRPVTVIGIMPAEFNLPLENEIWVPLALNTAEAAERARRSLSVLGRLAPGVSIAKARADLRAVSARLASAYPDANEGRSATVSALMDSVDDVSRRFVLVLLAATGFVLLLACVNIANLQLVSAVRREKEVAIQTVLGAGRFTILRELAMESLLIGIPGGALGLCLASWDMAASTRYLMPPIVYYWMAGARNMRITPETAWFCFALAIGASLVSVLPAALHLASCGVRDELNESLKESGRGSSAGRSAGRLRSIFAVAEISLALVLLIGAGLMVRAFHHMLTIRTGYNPKNLLSMETSLGTARYPDPVQIRAFAGRSLDALGQLPGVRGAAIVSPLGQVDAVVAEGRAAPRPGEPRPDLSAVTARYLTTLGVPVLMGRDIGRQDTAGSTPVVVVSESIARHYWPGANPLGRRIRWSLNAGPWLTVVGVCGDLTNWFDGTPWPQAYVAFPQQPSRHLDLLLRTSGDPLVPIRAAAARIHEIDPLQPLFDVKSMEQQIFEQTSGVRASAVMMSGYALIAFLLAISGVYAVVSYSVAQRTHEIGIRIALGANRASVVRLTLGQALRIAFAGLAIGIPAAFALTRLMSGVLYDTIALDVVTFAAFAGSLALFALLAGYIPARRAAATDPIAALRHE